MSGMSNVGGSNIYADGDQRTYKDSEIKAQQDANRYHEGKPHSHLANDSKDERSIANKLAREEKREHEPEHQTLEHQRLEKDARAPAAMHGNEPSKGAKIDQELREEEEEAMKGKGSFGTKQH